MSKPQLSIGIIFRNDIRCIERCLKALQPLREAVPCELVMADTGSEDGSREIAEKYADILIDFPWINDFSAARNAVMDRCSGAWFLSVDTDEYLKPDVSELVTFLAGAEGRNELVCTVVVRNHTCYEMDGNYTDFMASRMLRMSTGVRYEGTIHERWTFGGTELYICPLPNVIFDHDGYVDMYQNSNSPKRERNARLLRAELEKDPDRLLGRLQLLEVSTAKTPDYREQMYKTVELIKRKVPHWDTIGPTALRYVVYAAGEMGLPEMQEWIALAWEMFPQSMYTRLDVEYASLTEYWKAGDFAACISSGERYLKAMEEFRHGADPMARVYGILKMASPMDEQSVRIYLASACQKEGDPGRAMELLSGLDFTLLDENQTGNMLKVAQDIQFSSWLDCAPLALAAWEGISRPEPSERRRDQRLSALVKTAGAALSPEVIKADRESGTGFWRFRYTFYLALRDKCDIGRAAAVLEMVDTAEMEAALAEVENWNNFSIHALRHALECGVRFPLPGKTLNVEEMDVLACRLASAPDTLLPLALKAAAGDFASDWQQLLWRRGLVLAELRVFSWGGGELDAAQGMALARAFANLEAEFLPRCYAPGALREDSLFVLPPMHRFGWYLVQAFEALDAGDAAGYVRLLREGLAHSPEVKPMVEFLVNSTPQLQTPEPSAELRALAEQIRTVLSNFSPDDPAVAALKASEAYQKVADLIEGAAVPVVGGLVQ